MCDYRVSNARMPGVVMFWEASRRTENCDDDPSDPLKVEEEEPHDPPIGIKRFNFNDIDDEIRRWMDEHPVEVEAIKTGVNVAAAATIVAALRAASSATTIAAALGPAAAAVALLMLLLAINGDAPFPVASGDPHLYTLDRLSYDLQAVGEFHLLEIPQHGIDVQMRTRPVGSSVSVTDRVATEVNGYLVELTNSGPLVDGEPVSLADGEGMMLGDDAMLRRDGSRHLLHWRLGVQVVTLSYQRGQVGLSVPSGMPTWGLVGDNDGDASNDLRLADGTKLSATTTDFVDTMTLNQTGTWKVILDPQQTAVGWALFRAWTVP